MIELLATIILGWLALTLVGSVVAIAIESCSWTWRGVLWSIGGLAVWVGWPAPFMWLGWFGGWPL